MSANQQNWEDWIFGMVGIFLDTTVRRISLSCFSTVITTKYLLRMLYQFPFTRYLLRMLYQFPFTRYLQFPFTGYLLMVLYEQVPGERKLKVLCERKLIEYPAQVLVSFHLVPAHDALSVSFPPVWNFVVIDLPLQVSRRRTGTWMQLSKLANRQEVEKNGSWEQLQNNTLWSFRYKLLS